MGQKVESGDIAVTNPYTMHVVHLITDLGTGGAETMLLKVIRATKADTAHTVISLHSKGDIGPFIEAEGVSVYALGIQRGAISVGGVVQLMRMLRRLNPDVVQGWMYHANLAATVARMLSRAPWPLSWSIRFSIDNMREKRLSRIVIRLGAVFSANPDAIIYNSERSKEQHERAGYSAKHGLSIPNGFELDRFDVSTNVRARARSEFGIGDSQKLVGQLCRLSPMKDVPNFVRAAARIARLRDDVVFVVAGSGIPSLKAEYPEVTSLVEALGTRLKLLPVQADVVPLISSLDVLVLSSAWGEGFPNVLGEAMACGVPCVATDVGESRSIIGDTGILVPASNEHRLAEAVLQILSMDAESYASLSARAREKVRANYAIGAIAERYKAVWNNLVRK